MKKSLSSIVAALLLMGVASLSVTAAEEAAKEVTIKGTAVCTKCALKETKGCQTAVKVKENQGETLYYLAKNKAAKEVTHAVCGGVEKQVTATGTVAEQDGKKILTASKVEVEEKKEG